MYIVGTQLSIITFNHDRETERKVYTSVTLILFCLIQLLHIYIYIYIQICKYNNVK